MMHQHWTFIACILWIMITVLLSASESAKNHSVEYEGLFLLTQNRVYKIDEETSGKTQILDGLSYGTAIDFDFEKKILVLGDQRDDCLYKVDMETGNKTVLATGGDINVPSALAVDWIYGNVYWTDVNAISVVSLDGEFRKVLFRTYLNSLSVDIVLNPVEGWMFWSDPRGEMIERAGMDGTQRSAIVFNIGRPTGLALDFASRKIFWIDSQRKEICSSNYDGSNMKVIVKDAPVYLARKLDLFEDWLYWDDWNTHDVYRAEKLTGDNIKNIDSSISISMGLCFIHGSKQPKGRNYCAELANCSHLCLAGPRLGDSKKFTCACQDGMELADQEDCIRRTSRSTTTTPLTTSVHPLRLSSSRALSTTTLTTTDDGERTFHPMTDTTSHEAVTGVPEVAETVGAVHVISEIAVTRGVVPDETGTVGAGTPPFSQTERATEGKITCGGDSRVIIFGVLLGLTWISVIGFCIYKRLLRNTIIHLENPVYRKFAKDPSSLESKQAKESVILNIKFQNLSNETKETDIKVH